MKILLATDGSEYSESAAQFLCRMPWTPEDSIMVFHAIYAIPFQDDEQFHFDTLKAIKISIAPKIIDSTIGLLQTVRASLSTEIDEFAPSQCTPDQCMIDAAQLSGVDLIVMGARGIKGVKSLVVGSVTKSVALHSPIPVLVIKPTMPERTGSMKILFATDGSGCSLATGEFLLTLPMPESTELAILHVLAPAFSDVPEKFLAGLDQESKDAMNAVHAREKQESATIVEQAKKQLRKRFKHLHASATSGDPSMEILRAAETLNADLIVLGCRSLRGIQCILGSVSQNVLAHANCSVLIGKMRQE
jgi:nucleotide-binding universal stress UspA family protein